MRISLPGYDPALRLSIASGCNGVGVSVGLGTGVGVAVAVGVEVGVLVGTGVGVSVGADVGLGRAVGAVVGVRVASSEGTTPAHAGSATMPRMQIKRLRLRFMRRFYHGRAHPLCTG